MWQEGLPVSVPSTAELEQPVGEGAPLSDHCVVERVLIIVNDGKQFSSVLLSTTDSKDSSLRPSTEPAFFMI